VIEWHFGLEIDADTDPSTVGNSLDTRMAGA